MRRVPALDAVLGQQVPGGCGDCNAIQEVTRDEDGIYHLNIHHDDTCPVLRWHQAQGPEIE